LEIYNLFILDIIFSVQGVIKDGANGVIAPGPPLAIQTNIRHSLAIHTSYHNKNREK
jgi:hypothetical protein